TKYKDIYYAIEEAQGIHRRDPGVLVHHPQPPHHGSQSGRGCSYFHGPGYDSQFGRGCLYFHGPGYDSQFGRGGSYFHDPGYHSQFGRGGPYFDG
ncbi:hypothetical protein Tco_0460122, partial [Tanacetum coccineum]